MTRAAAIFFALLCIAAHAAGQTKVTGRVMSPDGPLAGAGVHAVGGPEGAVSARDGSFTITIGSGARRLAASYLGYRPDTVAVGPNVEFTLEPDGMEIDGVTVEGSAAGTVLARLTPLKSEMISGTGLVKMACCTLAESFENSATVTVGFTDAVSGARQVQLLGLAGIYSQTLAENIPALRGLAATYGWDYTPGPWLESIQISKGASSVSNGYESVTGQMNLEFRKPEATEPLFVNLFAADDGMMEGNVAAAAQVGGRLWTGLMLNGVSSKKEHDHNGDGFMDMPRVERANLYNRWFYENARGTVESRTGVKLLWEERGGGQIPGVAAPPLFTSWPFYTTAIMNRHLALENKTGFSVGRHEGRSVGIVTAFTHHEQRSRFGRKRFDGVQNSFYANVLFNSGMPDGRHNLTAGASFAYDHYNMEYSELPALFVLPPTDLGRVESTPGVFAQYTFSPDPDFTFMAGLRADHNSRFGWLVTPRANVRYSIADGIVVVRASAGRGFRSPNAIAENIGLLATSRRINAGQATALDIESAWNLGGNVSFYIPVWAGREMVLSLDRFHTDFQNQAIVDAERDATDVYFYNLDGRSRADVWQADLSVTIVDGIDLFAAFRHNDTKITYANGRTVEKPLTSRYRGLVNLACATKFRKWVFDMTMQVNGPSRLPSPGGYDAPAEHSPWFPVWFAQVTKNTKRFDAYVGIENAFGFTQRHPILGADDPWGAGFDSSRVWGPITGRRVYAGIRLRIGRL